MRVVVDTYKEIRKDKVKGMSERAISDAVGVARGTVRRYMNGEHMPEEKRTRNKPRTVMTDEVVSFVKDRLEEGKEFTGKMKYTATRIYELLVEELGFEGSVSSVRNLVRTLKGEGHEAYLPISYDPGDVLQVDWGTEKIDLDGEITNVKYFCAILCYSDAKFSVAYRQQTTDCFLDALRRTFEFFGRVPGRVIYDNGREASKDGYGKDAVPVEKYELFAAHYAFEPVFCNPRSGHEKGKCERLVKQVRDHVMTPVLHVKSMDELNEMLEAWCVKNMECQRSNSDMTIRQLFDEERPEMNPLPLKSFDWFERREVKVSAYSTVRFEANSYSVPCKYSGKKVTICIRPETLEIYADGEEIARYPRCYGHGRCVYTLEHFLELLYRKHRGILKCKPVRDNVPQYFIDWLDGQKLGARRTVELLELGLLNGFKEAMRGEIVESVPEQVYEDDVTVEEQDLTAYDELFESV